MSRPLHKSLVAWFISMMLLYYSAAWTLLRCLHDDDHSMAPVELTETAARAEVSYPQYPSHSPENFECIGSVYHAESLAASYSSFQPPRWTVRIISHATDSSILDGTAAGGARGRWLRAVFDRFASPVFFLDLPRYLSLSVFRI